MRKLQVSPETRSAEPCSGWMPSLRHEDVFFARGASEKRVNVALQIPPRNEEIQDKKLIKQKKGLGPTKSLQKMHLLLMLLRYVDLSLWAMHKKQDRLGALSCKGSRPPRSFKSVLTPKDTVMWFSELKFVNHRKTLSHVISSHWDWQAVLLFEVCLAQMQYLHFEAKWLQRV